MPINPNGYWEGLNKDTTSGHYFDPYLAHYLLSFFKHESVNRVVDLGCGDGKYVKFFRQNSLNADGYDGNPDTPAYTDNMCGVLDLAVPHTFETPYDWVLSLEVGEHLPKQFEDIFMNNLHNNNTKGIILSWALEGQGGHGHFNERNNDYIKEKMCKLGYVNDVYTENVFRSVACIGWFKKTIMVFRKVQAS